MKRFVSLFLVVLSIFSAVSFAATEIRPLGGPGANNNGDILFGSGYWDSGLSRRVYRINASMIPFLQDNTIKVGNSNLYGLSSGAMGAWKYIYFDQNGNLVTVGIGAAGTCMVSNGPTSHPSQIACGSGTGSASGTFLVPTDNGYIQFGALGETGGPYRIVRTYPGLLRITPYADDGIGILMDNTGKVYLTGNVSMQGATAFSGSPTMNSNVPFYFGDNTSSRYSCKYNSTTKQFICTTALTGSTMTSTDPAFQLTFSDNGVSTSGQRVFGVKVNNTLVFYIDEAGNVTATGSFTAPQFISNTPNGYRGYNAMNTGGYLGTVTKGLSQYDGDTLVNKTYDGAGFRSQAVLVPVPAAENTVCSPGMYALDNTWRYDCYLTNYWRTSRLDNTWKSNTGGGGGTSDNTVTIARVQEAGYSNPGGTASYVDLAFTSSNTAGNLIVVTAWGVEGATITGVTDTRNSYTKGAAKSDNTMAMYYAQNIGSGTNTVRVQWSGTVSYPRVSIHEWSGAATTGAYDVGAAGANRAGSATTNGNYTDNVTTTASGDLVIGVFLDVVSGWGGTAAAGTGYTARYDSGGDYLVESLVQTSAGSVRATMTPPNAENYDWLIGSFKKP